MGWSPGGRDQSQASKSLLPVEAHRMRLLPAAVNCDKWNVTTQGSLLETQCPEFFLVADCMGTLCLACTKVPDSEGKQVFSINHSVYTNILGHSYQFWEWWGPSWNPWSQIPAKGQPGKLAFQRTTVKAFSVFWKLVTAFSPWASSHAQVFCRLSNGWIFIHSFSTYLS